MININANTKLFLKLLSISLLVLLVLGSFIAYISQIGNLFLILTFIVVALGLIILAGLFLVLKKQQISSWFERLISFTMNLFYPVILAIGTFVGKEKDQIRASFIAVHNQIAKLKDVKVKAEDVLLLLPHCLQYSECTHRVTTDVDNCKRCGLCRLADLLELRDKYGINIAVATGGTLARKKIIETKPQVVIGVACERDLVSGIQDVKKIHVLGVTNERPFGPCFNTSVDLNEIETVVKNVIKE